MSDQETPQIYLVTPAEFDLEEFPALLSDILGSFEIACVRIALSTRDEGRIIKSADAIREVCHAHDVAVVIETHVLMVDRLGLDGVHLTDGARSIRKVRKDLGEDAIVGTFCAASRHDGITAGELNADYISFGPLGGSALGDGTLAEADLFQWWSEMIEVPIVAEGGLTVELVKTFTPITDFFAFRDEIWTTKDPKATLAEFIQAMAD